MIEFIKQIIMPSKLRNDGNIQKMTPIALFTYNRPQNLQRTLDCLRNNNFNLLYIFSDGPKREADEEKVKEVRKILDQIDWVDKGLHFGEQNRGLPDSEDNVSTVMRREKQ